MIKKYIDHTNENAFTDFPPIDKEYCQKLGLLHECPKCKGHGGWNLLLNAYPLHHHPNTQENRHKFSNFRARCDHCAGWGFTKNPSDHIHTWVKDKVIGRCLTQHRCTQCDMIWTIDSSD